MSRRNSSLRLCALLLAILLLAGVPTAIAQSCGNPGTDGPGTISGIVNTYYPASTATETINAGATSIALGTVNALAWTGTVGGIVALDVAGTLNLGGGTINASGKGFRGGGGVQLAGGTGTNTDYRRAAGAWGGSKGEGVAGTPRYVF